MGNELKENQGQQIVTEKMVTEYLQNFGYMKNLTQQEAYQFIMICKAQNLNPIKREAYAIKYNGSFQIITGYEIYIKRANETGLLDGWKCEVTRNMEGKILGAKTIIYRKDWKYPFEHEVSMSEYNRQMALWKDKPETMIKKVCIAQAFRLCFSSELGGLPYTQEEQISSNMVNAEVVYGTQPEKAQPVKQKKEIDVYLPKSVYTILKDKGYPLFTKKNERIFKWNDKFIEKNIIDIVEKYPDFSILDKILNVNLNGFDEEFKKEYKDKCNDIYEKAITFNLFEKDIAEILELSESLETKEENTLL